MERQRSSYGPSSGKVKKSQAVGTSVREIVARVQAGGQLPKEQLTFGDVSGLGDFETQMERVVRANAFFSGLSAVVRARFKNSPAEFYRFAADEKNFVEVLRMCRGEAAAVRYERDVALRKARAEVRRRTEEDLLRPQEPEAPKA